MVTPTFDAAMEDDALGLHLLDAAVDVVLLHLEVGDAVAQQPAGLRLALEDMHVVADAGELLGGGQARRARADDGDALAGRDRPRGSGLTQPISQALSAIACSIVLIVTGWFSRLSVQASSQGAGQMRPVNSGKLLVEWRLRAASSQSFWKTRSFQSGIWLCTGQPVGPWQNGMPQSMQRAACLRRSLVVERQRELAEMANAVAGELILLLLPVVFEKARDLAHPAYPSVIPVLRSPGSMTATADPFSSRFLRCCFIHGVPGSGRACPECPIYSAACSIRTRSISCSARRYSTGITFTNFVR